MQFRDEETGEHICTDYGDRVIFGNSRDYDTLKRNMVKVSPILFSRSPDVAMSPQGDNEQFNRAFAKMVARHNVNRQDGDEYRISRADIDRLRVESEQQFMGMSGGVMIPGMIGMNRSRHGSHHRLSSMAVKWYLVNNAGPRTVRRRGMVSEP